MASLLASDWDVDADEGTGEGSGGDAGRSKCTDDESDVFVEGHPVLDLLGRLTDSTDSVRPEINGTTTPTPNLFAAWTKRRMRRVAANPFGIWRDIAHTKERSLWEPPRCGRRDTEGLDPWARVYYRLPPELRHHVDSYVLDVSEAHLLIGALLGPVCIGDGPRRATDDDLAKATTTHLTTLSSRSGPNHLGLSTVISALVDNIDKDEDAGSRRRAPEALRNAAAVLSHVLWSGSTFLKVCPLPDDLVAAVANDRTSPDVFLETRGILLNALTALACSLPVWGDECGVVAYPRILPTIAVVGKRLLGLELPSRPLPVDGGVELSVHVDYECSNTKTQTLKRLFAACARVDHYHQRSFDGVVGGTNLHTNGELMLERYRVQRHLMSATPQLWSWCTLFQSSIARSTKQPVIKALIHLEPTRAVDRPRWPYRVLGDTTSPRELYDRDLLIQTVYHAGAHLRELDRHRPPPGALVALWARVIWDIWSAPNFVFRGRVFHTDTMTKVVKLALGIGCGGPLGAMLVLMNARRQFDDDVMNEGASYFLDCSTLSLSRKSFEERGGTTAGPRDMRWDDRVAARVVNMFATRLAISRNSLSLSFRCIQTAEMTPRKAWAAAREAVVGHASRYGVTETRAALNRPECRFIIEHDAALMDAASGFLVNTQRKAVKRKGSSSGSGSDSDSSERETRGQRGD